MSVRLRSRRLRRGDGFTIVELLIVIIVIGILATLVLLGYNGVQDQARVVKVKHDLQQLNSAVVLARQQAGKPLIDITGNNATMYWCTQKADGTNLATLPKTDNCWVYYLAALKKIGQAANIELNDFTDPYGRPYYIDENDTEPGYAPCISDAIGEYTYPFKSGYAHFPNTTVAIKPYSPNC